MKKTHISTRDEEFAEDLAALDIQGVEVFTRLTASVPTEMVFEYIIKFASEIAMQLFSKWLSERVVRKRPHDTRINGIQVSADNVKNLIVIQTISNEKDE